jgi:hypothetical protein
LVPMTDLPLKREGTLRVDPPKNNQKLRVRFANKYEIGRVHLHAPDSVQRVPRLGSVD